MRLQSTAVHQSFAGPSHKQCRMSTHRMAKVIPSSGSNSGSRCRARDSTARRQKVTEIGNAAGTADSESKPAPTSCKVLSGSRRSCFSRPSAGMPTRRARPWGPFSCYDTPNCSSPSCTDLGLRFSSVRRQCRRHHSLQRIPSGTHQREARIL